MRNDEIISKLTLISKKFDKIGRRFLALDIIVLISLFCIFYPSSFFVDRNRKQNVFSQHDNLFTNIESEVLAIVINILLAFSAYSIARFVKKSTNQEPNSCLVWTHVMLLGVEIITVFI